MSLHLLKQVGCDLTGLINRFSWVDRMNRSYSLKSFKNVSLYYSFS